MQVLLDGDSLAVEVQNQLIHQSCRADTILVQTGISRHETCSPKANKRQKKGSGEQEHEGGKPQTQSGI